MSSSATGVRYVVIIKCFFELYSSVLTLALLNCAPSRVFIPPPGFEFFALFEF